MSDIPPRILSKAKEIYESNWPDPVLAIAEALMQASNTPPAQKAGERDGGFPICSAPKTGERILIKSVTFGWSSDICQNVATGDKWVEARWGKDLSGKETWVEWCGNDKTHTTDSLTPLAWAPTPKQAQSMNSEALAAHIAELQLVLNGKRETASW